MAKDIFRRAGRKTWYLNLWDPATGKKIRKALGSNKRRAEQIAAEWRTGLYSGDLRYKTKAKSVTLDEFIPRVIDEHFAALRTLPDARRALLRFRAFAGNRPLASITKGLLHEYVTNRRKNLLPPPLHSKSTRTAAAREARRREQTRRGIANGTVNKDIGVINCMMNRAVEWGEIESNPLAGFKKLNQKGSIRKRYLHPEEIKALLEASASIKKTMLLPAVLLALYVGRRRGEILGLKKRDYDRKNGYLYLRKTKKGEPDQIPVPPAAQRILDKLCDEARCDWLFPNRQLNGPVADIDAAFQRAKRNAGITDFRFHDIRHTAISYMIMAGVDYFTIAQLAGHTTPTMIEQRYGHLSPKHRQASSILFGSYMDRLTGEAPAPPAGHPSPPEAPIVAQVAGLLTDQQPLRPDATSG